MPVPGFREALVHADDAAGRIRFILGKPESEIAKIAPDPTPRRQCVRQVLEIALDKAD
jgi:hypothetical protein